MGMPWDELHTFLGLRDGILHPERYDPVAASDPMARMAVVNEWGQKIYEYFNGALDAREANPTDDILTHFITAEVDGDKMTREEILDLCFLFLIAGLDTVSDSLTCMFAFLADAPRAPARRSSTTRRSSPARSRRCCAASRRCRSACPGSPPRTSSCPTARSSRPAPRSR